MVYEIYFYTLGENATLAPEFQHDICATARIPSHSHRPWFHPSLGLILPSCAGMRMAGPLPASLSETRLG